MSKPRVIPGDPMIVLPPHTYPPEWRLYSIRPEPNDAQQVRIVAAVSALGVECDLKIRMGLPVLAVDTFGRRQAEIDPEVASTIATAWG